LKIVGWHLVRLVNEAASEMSGTVLESIRSEPESGRLLLVFEARRRRFWLVASARGDRQAFFWTTDKEKIPGHESYKPTEKFNRLKRCRLVQMAIPAPDRVVRLSFERPGGPSDELTHYDLWITWTGAAGNIWLVQPTDNIVLETFWQSEPSLQGANFSHPAPPSLLNWQTVSFPEYERARASDRERAISEFLQKRFWGIDGPLARMVESQVVAFADQPDQVWREFSTVLSSLRSAADSKTPVALVPAGDIVPVLGLLAGEERNVFSSLSAALAASDTQSGEALERTVIVARLRGELRRRIQRLQHRVRQVDIAIAEGEQVAQLRHQADLLGTQRHLLHPGMSEIVLEDWVSGAQITIQLDPGLRPQENIDALYHRVSKLTLAARNAHDTRPALVAELTLWESRLKSLESSSTGTEELEDLRRLTGLTTPKHDTQRSRPPKRLPYREFRVGNDVIWVGRSNRDNDQLTMKLARPDDLFLHAHQSGGAHVILRRESGNREHDHQSIVAAAQLAAFFSKAKHSHLVPVIYTDIRHVRKPRKAPPGLVQVTREKSIMVRPLPPPGYHESGYKE